MKPTLVIGNKNYSSWSLRAWLGLRKSGAPFEEKRIAFGSEEFTERISDYSPTRRVPVLHHDGSLVWDSLSICEYVNEAFTAGRLWPDDLLQRAEARSISAEMHAGFELLRERMPMNCRARGRKVAVDNALAAEIARIESIWDGCRASNAAGGPWLYGRFSIADAMFAPVALRFASYGVSLDGAAQTYSEFVLADPDLGDWIRAAELETEVVEADEVGK